MALADKLREKHELAATTQQALRNGRRVIRRIAEDDQISLPAVLEPQPEAVPAPSHTSITVSPLDLPADQFKAGLDRRKQNRELLMEWLRSALVEGVDFGRIHVASRERCQFARQGRPKDCTEPGHWSKPSLFKPGAERISGMLGMTVHYPSLPDYEQAVLRGVTLATVMLRCELRDALGRVVAEGVGARSVGQDYGDINKTLKMAEKSAHIDATLRLAGLSEIYTQDIEDRPIIEEGPPPEPPSTGKAKPRRSAKAASSATPAADGNAATEAGISQEELASLRQQIRSHGFTEKRVLAWLFKQTEGAVSQLDQLTQGQYVSLLQRLDVWSEGEKTFANGHIQSEGGCHE